MITVSRGGLPEEARQQARHRLFVEGRGDRSLDPLVIAALLPMISIEPLGPSYSVRCVAEALAPVHPNYYFLTDRDDSDDAAVEASWRRFPDPDQSNLIIWRKRELENYFLDPDYLAKSRFIKPRSGKPALIRAILEVANRRLFMDAANLVVLHLRNEQKSTWITLFTRLENFPDAHAARTQLLHAPELQQRAENVSQFLDRDRIQELFDACLAELSGGALPLTMDRGTWRNRMSGKEILHAVVQKHFRVRDSSDNLLQGPEQRREVFKDLLGLPLTDQPEDFQKLHRMIEDRVRRD